MEDGDGGNFFGVNKDRSEGKGGGGGLIVTGNPLLYRRFSDWATLPRREGIDRSQVCGCVSSLFEVAEAYNHRLRNYIK